MIDTDTLLRAAFAERAMVRHRVRKRVGEAFADDVTQDVYERAIILIRAGRLVVDDSADLRSAIRGWLTRVLWNVCGDRLTREDLGWVRGEHVDTANLPASDPVARLEARSQLRAIDRALTKWYRPIVAGLAIGETLQETAARLGLPMGTVDERSRHARRVLRKRRPHER
jgi:RNA polymerase sigma-70 factor (ECF subfamily)